MEVKYQTYKEELPEFMAGYTGHIPTVQKEEFVNKIVHTKHIPDYKGHISSIVSENAIGESYGKLTAKSLAGQIPKGMDVPPSVRYTSISRKDYIDRNKVQAESTAELLGITDPHVTYKKPIPIDTINKFYGVTGNQYDAEIIEKQNFEKNYEKFWQFLESNDYEGWGLKKEPKKVDITPDMKYDPIPGYMGTTRAIVSENIFGMTYKNSLRNAEEIEENINKNRAEQLFISSQSLGPFKKNY